jgi:REP element-mobilizing transposase RayT
VTRIRRYHEDNEAYFVTTVMRARRTIFEERETATLLRDILDACRRRYQFLVLAYVIMPDHLHAVIVPREGDTISQVMRYVKGAFARAYNARHGTRGSVWQPRFHDVMIRREAEVGDRIEYIEHKPRMAGLVANPEDYEFSSAHSSWSTDLERWG